jgi:hypothetical protein
MLRIEKESDGQTTILRFVGRIQSVNIGNIRAQMDDENGRILMDLGEVTLVSVEVVRFLSDCEDEGIELLHCPPYIREWILRERAEGNSRKFRTVPNLFVADYPYFGAFWCGTKLGILRQTIRNEQVLSDR